MGEQQKVDSTSDERTVNNVMRHEYRVLSEEEKALMKRIKDLGREFHELVHSIRRRDTANSDVNPLRTPVSRELSIAATRIEEAVMWAVKHVTG